MCHDFLSCYTSALASAHELADDERTVRRDRVKRFSDGFIEQGGTSTDLIVRSIGAEKTGQFYDEVFYGTARV